MAKERKPAHESLLDGLSICTSRCMREPSDMMYAGQFDQSCEDIKNTEFPADELLAMCERVIVIKVNASAKLNDRHSIMQELALVLKDLQQRLRGE